MTSRTTGPRRGRWIVLLLAAAALVAVDTRPAWVTAHGRTALEDVTVQVSGAQVAPQAGAATLVLLACAGAVALVGRAGRVVVALVTAGAGALVVAAAAGVLADPAGAARGPVADVTGVGRVPDVASTAWPVVALVLGAAVVLLAVALVRAPGAWDQRSRRHDAPAAALGAGEAPRDDARDDWDALSRGDDPT